MTRTVRDIGAVLRRPAYVGYTLSFALAFTAMFAYISGSPFVLQDVLHLSTGGYALAFAVNAGGLAGVSMIGARLTSRVPPRRLMITGLTIMVTATAALLVVALAGAPRWPMLALLFVTVAALGLVMGNAAALASAEVTDVSGTGSALLGALQFGLGALVSPLVGSSATTMAVAMVTASVLAMAALVLTRRHAPAPVEALANAT